MGFMRWLTVSVPGDDGREILLERPGAPSHDDATAAEIRELVAKGAGGGTLIFSTDDCQATYDALVAAGRRVHRGAHASAPTASTARCAIRRATTSGSRSVAEASRRSRCSASARPAAASRATCARRASRSAAGTRCPRRAPTRRARPQAADGADVVLSANSAADATDAARSVARRAAARAGRFADLNTGSPELKARARADRRADRRRVRRRRAHGTGARQGHRHAGAGLRRRSGAVRRAPAAARHARRGRRRPAGRRRRAQAAALDRVEGPRRRGPRGDGRGRGRRQGATRSGPRSSGSSPRPTRPSCERMLTGSRTHATRRTHEMEAVGEMLRDLGVPSWMSDGVRGSGCGRCARKGAKAGRSAPRCGDGAS